MSQNNASACFTLQRMNDMIQKLHYRPKPVDDSLSVYVFNEFLSKLDSDNRLFLDSEIKKLEVHKYQIDDYIKDKNCSFLTDFFLQYNKALNRYKSIITTLKKDNFPLSLKEQIHFSKKNFPYVKTEAELTQLYRKRILFNTLREIAELSNNKDSLTTKFNEIAPKYLTKNLDSYDCKTESITYSGEEFEGLFYQSFSSYFDPHTMYFSANDKSSFLSHISSDNLSFGLAVSLNEKDEIMVDDVIPGSSAYLSEKINAGDQIIKLKHKNNEYTTSCSSLEKIGEIFSASNVKNAEFTFRKKTGEVFTIPLEKTLLKDYENIVYSFVINEHNNKIGYIKIPSFYTIVEDSKTDVSSDVSKEILKLKQENVSSIIIDLQYNGGGSMQEAIALTGMFIDSGPIGLIHFRNNTTEIIKDSNRGMIYSGPMVVLINGFSASASELFTNAMQDYKRAVVVGQKSFGKATMQQIFPIDNKNSQFLKITKEEFYNITGKTNQYRGIKPDVEIPLLFQNQIDGEKDEETAIENDSINVKIKYTTSKKSTINKAIEKVIKTFPNDTIIQETTAFNTEIDAIYDNDLPSVTLNFDSVFSEVNRISKLWKKLETFSEKTFDINIENNSFDKENQLFDTFLKSYNEERIKAIKTNYSIYQAVKVCNELIKSNR